MAGIAIPENLRPTLAAIAKYHFWILAALVPLVLVPLLLVGTGSLRTRIETQRRLIESKLGQARSVTAVQPHPNDNWRTAIDADTEAVNRETQDEWLRFWHSQRFLRTWPAELGQPFLDDVARLKSGGKLDRQSLVRYQNMAPRLVRTLPARMGVTDAMVEAQRDGVLPDALARPGSEAARAAAAALEWNPASQKRLYDSFVWQRVPLTTQVLLAQEELWVYGLFCDLIGGFVKARGATGAHDSPLTLVDELVIGFPAVAQPDRGSREQTRILLPKTGDAPVDGMVGMDMPPGPDGEPAQAPWHPRFAGAGSGPRMEGVPGGEQAAGPTEDDFRGWIYVDFAGKPLSAADLAASPAMRMVHLVPFVLRVVIDQRHLDRLLATIAAAPVPIDVREVRVNPGTAVRTGSGPAGIDVSGMRGDMVDPSGGGRAGLRPNDVVVELRGTVALAAAPTVPPPPEAAP